MCGVVCATWAIRRDGDGERYGQHLVLGGPVDAQNLRQNPDDDFATETVSYSYSVRDACDDGDGVWAIRIDGDGGSALTNGDVEAWMP